MQIDLCSCPVKENKKPASGFQTARLPIDRGWRLTKQQAASIHLEDKLTFMVRGGDARDDRPAEYRSHG
jgi:hypothetical protein